MSLVACGINHKTAPLAIREQLFFMPDEMPGPLLELIQQVPVREVAILSTCNRTELYCEADAINEVLHWLKLRHKNAAFELEPYLYVHHEEEAVRHIIRVASGLDSMVVGEPQILGQLKSAVSLASQAGTLGARLHRLFQYVFSVTKQVRTDTAIGSSPVSIVYAAICLAKRIFTDLSSTSVMLIGAGETIELAAKHLRDNKVKQLFIANRTRDKAEAVANKFGGISLDMTAIPDYLAKADIIISATASPLPILGKGAIERAIKLRKHRPMFIVDIAVPRDVEPEVSKLSDVYLYTVDDLHAVIQENLDERCDAAQKAEAMIDIQVTHYMKYLRSLDAVATIRAYRKKVAKIRDDELAKALALLERGESAAELLATMARTLANKLMHTPCVELRRAAYEGQPEILTSAQQLLDLKEDI